jgi:AcrR family transcriptional regulator
VGSRTQNRISKAEQASSTRRRVVQAATTLFLRDGFVTATMAAIAKEAGVAVQTLYLSFGSKTAILQAAFDTALKGGDDPDGILESDWFQRVLTDTDGPSALRLFCSEARHVIARAAPLFDAMRAAAADPEVAEVLAHNKALRWNGYRMVAEAVASRAGFAPHLSLSEAQVVLYTVVSEDSFLLMVTECGWTPERWRDWTTQTCTAQLFPGRPAGRPEQ